MTEDKKELILSTARQHFLRYGFRRVTMNDLAEAAHMSRPTLYLVFSSKEEVFAAVLTQVFRKALNEIRQGLSRLSTPSEKLTFALEVWYVRPFELIQASPDAKDLLESSYEFATEAMTEANASFIDLLADVLQPLIQSQTEINLNPFRIASVLTKAVPGFKAAASDVTQLRQSIADLITIVLTGLQANSGY